MSFVRDFDHPNGLVPEIREHVEKHLGWRDTQNLRSACRVLHSEIKDDGKIPATYEKSKFWGYSEPQKFLVDFEEKIISRRYEEEERKEPRQRELIECMSGYYITDVIWLANYDKKQEQDENWTMDYRLTEKPKINQIAVVFCLGTNCGSVQKYLPMVCAPMCIEYCEGGRDDYEFCEMQFQNEIKRDMLNFFNFVPIREAYFLKMMYENVLQSFVLKITYENDSVHYLSFSMTGPSYKQCSSHDLIDHCAIICNNHLVDFNSDILASFTHWYTSIPTIAFHPGKTKEENINSEFERGLKKRFGGAISRVKRPPPMIQYPTYEKAIDERRCNWKIVADLRRLMYLPMANNLPQTMPSGVNKPANRLRRSMVPGLEMRVFKSARAIADCIYDDQYVHHFDNEYRAIIGIVVSEGESKRAKKGEFNRQKKILEAKNLAERRKLKLEHEAERTDMRLIYEAHGVLKIDKDEARKNTPEIHIPNIRTTTLMLRYTNNNSNPSLLVLPCRMLPGCDEKPESLKYGRLLRNINGAVHSWPERWWRRIYEFLTSKTFIHSIHNPSYTCSALLVTDIKGISTAANGIKKKIKKILGDTVKVYEPSEGHCHMLLDGTFLSMIIAESSPASNGLYKLYNNSRKIKNYFPSLVDQHKLPEHHGITQIAIRIEIPSLYAFAKENNGEKLTDLLIEWGNIEKPIIDLLCNANAGPQRKKKKEEWRKMRNEHFAEKERKKLEREAMGLDANDEAEEQQEDEYLSAEEEQFEEANEGAVGGVIDEEIVEEQVIDWQEYWNEEQNGTGHRMNDRQLKRRKKAWNRKKHEKYKLSGKKKDPWTDANGRIRFTLRAKSKEQIEKLLNQLEKFIK